MEKLEKVIRGLDCCLPETQEDAERGCGGCPYAECVCTVTLPVQMIEDIRALLESQKPGA